MWVFGYGSLIFKPPPHTDLRVSGYVVGYVRRFWQSSNDHRGTPESPGRVVTLIEKSHWQSLTDEQVASEKTWGVAYHIIPEYEQEVKEYLDLREINGYTAHNIDFIVEPKIEGVPDSIPVEVYIGTPDNPAFVGAQKLNDLAAHIINSRGPSGENKEYLYNLDIALKQLHPPFSDDEHVSQLTILARGLEKTALTTTSVRTDVLQNDEHSKVIATESTVVSTI